MVTAMYWMQRFLKVAMATIWSMGSDLELACNTEDGVFRFSSGIPIVSEHRRRQQLLRFLMASQGGGLFALLHISALSICFPSQAEILLLQISCMAIIGVPVAGVVIAFTAIFRSRDMLFWMRLADDVDNGRIDQNWRWNMSSCLDFISTVILCAIIIAYIMGRMVLVILAFTQLRSLPPLAFHTVQWTAYIPHL